MDPRLNARHATLSVRHWAGILIPRQICQNKKLERSITQNLLLKITHDCDFKIVQTKWIEVQHRLYILWLMLTEKLFFLNYFNLQQNHDVERTKFQYRFLKSPKFV